MNMMHTEVLLIVGELLLHLVQHIVLVNEAPSLLLHNPLNGRSAMRKKSKYYLVIIRISDPHQFHADPDPGF